MKMLEETMQMMDLTPSNTPISVDEANSMRERMRSMTKMMVNLQTTVAELGEKVAKQELLIAELSKRTQHKYRV